MTHTARSILWGFLALAASIPTYGIRGEGLPTDTAERRLVLPDEPYRYGDDTLPEHFRDPAVAEFDTTPDDNRATDAGVTLGRVLFYDTRLSANHTTACASCHHQQQAFADPRPVSPGFEGRLGERNAMSLVNLRWGRAKFFWDERAETLEEQALVPLHSRIEMGLSPGEVVERLADRELYPELFAAAFGEAEITDERVSKALTQFLRALVSGRSKFDEGFVAAGSKSDVDFANFTPAENRGKQLFQQHCMQCHTLGKDDQIVLFHMFRSLTNGLDASTDVADVGEGDVTMIPSDAGHFKASSLRNVEHTAPYMHDGRLTTLEEVIEHYSTGVQRHPALGPVIRFQFSVSDKQALVDFLKTLSDPAFLTDPRFSDPWVPALPPIVVAATPTQPAVDPPAAQLSSQELNNRVTLRLGLPYGTVLPWLKTLDTDEDGALTPAEYRLIAEVGSPMLRRERDTRIPAFAGAATSTSDERPRRPRRATDASGRAAAFARLITYGDGGRADVFIDRFFDRWGVAPEERPALRRSIRGLQITLAGQVEVVNHETEQALATTLGHESFRELKRLVLLREDNDPPPAAPSEEEIETALAVIASFDTNGDGKLDESELAPLAHTLESAPGGFAPPPPTVANMLEFHERIMAYDADGDGAVTLLELPERMSVVVRHGDQDGDGKVTAVEAEAHLLDTAFANLARQGIYIGGGFDNVYIQSERLLAELSLDEPVRSEAQSILAKHNRRIRELADRAVAAGSEEVLLSGDGE